MMLLLKLFLASFLVIAWFSNDARAADGTGSVSCVDEEGRAIPGALIRVGWNLPRAPGNGWGEGDAVSKDFVADGSGIGTISFAGVPSISVTKPGYYTGFIDGMSSVVTSQFKDPVLSKNRPVLTVALRRKVAPLPMFVRKIMKPLPRQGEAIGFDFEAGDWVAPLGKGRIPDMKIEVKQQGTSEVDFDRDIKLEFQNDGDGLLRVPVAPQSRTSALRLPQEAPLRGYLRVLSWRDWYHASPARIAEFKLDKEYVPGTNNPKFKVMEFHFDESDNYIFRIRGNSSGQNDVAVPLYGKIHGPIEIDAEAVRFNYYLNPTGTVSLEWDTEHNLAGRGSVGNEP